MHLESGIESSRERKKNDRTPKHATRRIVSGTEMLGDATAHKHIFFFIKHLPGPTYESLVDNTDRRPSIYRENEFQARPRMTDS